MPRRSAGSTFDTVRAIANSLPDAEESTSWGVPSIKLRGRLLACMASHRSAEPNTLVVRVSVDQRDAMIADDPDVYYLKDHYAGYPCVLVRLARIRREALKDLLQAGWRFVEATARRPRRIVSTPQLRNSRPPTNAQRPTSKTPKARRQD